MPGDTLSRVRFITGLGNSPECPLILSNPIYDLNSASIIFIDGKFTLSNICREGGARLVNPFAESGIINISPNPAEDKLKIEIGLVENGIYELCIYNIYGQRVKSIDSGLNDQIVIRSVETDIRDVASGVYYIVLMTRNQYFTKKILIGK